MVLCELLRNISKKEFIGDPALEVRGLAYNSKAVEEGDLFFAIPGFATDGFLFIDEALRAGAVAVVAVREPPGAEGCVKVIVEDPREALALASARYYGFPSEKLRVAAATGTNGKTTTCHYLERILNAAGEKTGLIGTLYSRIGAKEDPSSMTTPESLDLQRRLSEMVRAGCTWVVMEASSHALNLKRLKGVSLDAGIFTNLSRDHLDFHGAMEQYRDAKKILFGMLAHEKESGRDVVGVLNNDDPASRFFRDAFDIPWVTYGLFPQADVYPEMVEYTIGMTRARVRCPEGAMEFRLHMPGRMNLMNAMAAASTALSCGIAAERVIEGVEGLKGVPGRFEVIRGTSGVTAVVDYAHTPDALEKVLMDIRSIHKGKVITVFGCGGDRDRGKRPEMGRIAAELSDYTIITVDNPRTEDPAQIVQDILPGITPDTPYEVIMDREEAIVSGLRRAVGGEVVLIAGKGHENYQILNDGTIHFDDREVVRDFFRLQG
jgi:UDP-N-acetylmuramoyl-L-alanyl-D-glutamate--2,6-diaminopimelate ligase